VRAGGARRVVPHRADDGELAGQRIGTAEPVDLTAVRRAEDGEDRPVALRRIAREIRLLEEDRLARPSAHDHAPDRSRHLRLR
jgi:hypothetical protein